MKFDANDFGDGVLVHYGILRRSGRYPWGSGDNQNTRNKDFLDYIRDLRSQGLSNAEIAKGYSTPDQKITALNIIAAESIAVNQQKAANISMAERLRAKSYSYTAIAERMSTPEKRVAESTVRGWLAPGAKDRADILFNTAKMLKKEVDDAQVPGKLVPIDVGKGVETFKAGVSKTRFDTALAVLKEEGYEVHNVPQPRLNTGRETKLKVLCPPGTTQYQAFMSRNNVQQIKSFSEDGGRNFASLLPPLILDPKRVGVVFKEDGGDKADGMIYVRPGVKDVELGGSTYAQVRVAVGEDHYLKGMALYKSDLPAGVDVEFHTNKSKTPNKLDVMKKNSDEPGYGAIDEHPLMKSITRQIQENPGTSEARVTSTMNLVNEEGNWADWSRSLSSQMLSKQQPILAKTQLNKTYDSRLAEFKEINSLTNDTVRKKLLEIFANETDSAAVNLKAAALPNMGMHVILPIASIKPTEIYAPKYTNGTKVVLIRHPHAGPFEIPELIVNNKQREAKRLLGDAPDAVGIHTSVAQWLSGADFDGDTVLVIPNDSGKVKTTHPLDELKNFEPRDIYRGYDGMKTMSSRQTQTEMGTISNLITDMSLQNASHADLARAVKHSMVVIDAEKHGLNYKQSYNDNGIQQLKQKYQSGGASTLISRAGALDRSVPDRKLRLQGQGGPINRTTGAVEWVPTNKMRTNKKGERVPSTVKVKKLALTDDARTLMSTPTGTPMERLYADHSNKLKALANRARLETLKIKNPKVLASAKKVYAPQVESLKAKLFLADRNRPLERQAQAIAKVHVQARVHANPAMDEDSKKKITRQALTQARIQTGATKQDIKITDDEWEAIQAGAISNAKLIDVLNSADLDLVRSHATPKVVLLMTAAKTSRAKQMLKSGATRTEVARALGVSLTTLDNATKGE